MASDRDPRLQKITDLTDQRDHHLDEAARLLTERAAYAVELHQSGVPKEHISDAARLARQSMVAQMNDWVESQAPPVDVPAQVS